jgi:hypothetical protein
VEFAESFSSRTTSPASADVADIQCCLWQFGFLLEWESSAHALSEIDRASASDDQKCDANVPKRQKSTYDHGDESKVFDKRSDLFVVHVCASRMLDSSRRILMCASMT